MRAWIGRTGARRLAAVRPCARDLALLLLVWSTLASASGPGLPVASPVRDQKVILVPIHKARIVDLRSAVARVSVANPAIADILVVSPRQIYIVGKEFGTTNMVLWDDNDQVRDMMSLEVTHDIQTLKEKLHRMLPDEKIGVEAAQGALVLRGVVSSAPKMAAALQIAEQFAPSQEGQARIGLPGGGQPKVINLMQVGGSQQVLLEVKVAEINRSLSKKLDIDFSGMYDGGSIRIGAVNGGAAFPDYLTADGLRIPAFPPLPGGIGGPALPEFNPTDAGIVDTGAFINNLSGNFFFNVVLDIAKTEGLAKILAEPNLTALSGQEAVFNSGGEFPIPVSDDDNGTTIEYKEFGVGLRFVPTVLDSGLISLTVSVVVSDLSNDAATVVAPSQTSSVIVVPSLRKRSASSTLEIPSGQTLAIAGLLSENLTEAIDQFPGLGSLPLIGPLFRSQEYRKQQTELVIFVTPRLARPFAPELVKSPTDNFVEPNDTEFYLMGRLEGQRASATKNGGRLGPDKSGSEGVFGHDL